MPCTHFLTKNGKVVVDEKGRPLPDPNKCQGYKLAQKLLSSIQGRWEQHEKGLLRFRIEEFQKRGWTDTIEFFNDFLELKKKKSPSTYKGYTSYFKCHFEPFFKEYPVMLHDIQLDTLYKLKDSLKKIDITTNEKTDEPLSPKMQYNIMNCFHAFLRYAHRSKRIPEMPAFPEKGEYELIRGEIPEWMTKEERARVLAQIPEPSIYPFLWLNYHFRRPGEACALYKTDYDVINNAFIIRRGISNRQIVEQTKTHQIHYIPCKSEFTPIVKKLINQNPDTPFMFVNPLARRNDGRWTLESLRNVWYNACKKAKVKRIWLYRGSKHTSCTHFIEDGGTVEELRMITDLGKEAIQHYTDITLERKRDIMERSNVLVFKDKNVL
jgi:integrase